MKTFKLGYLLLPIFGGVVASVALISLVLSGREQLVPWMLGCSNYAGLAASYFYTSWRSHRSKDLWRQVEVADLMNIVLNPLNNGFCAWLAAHLFGNLEQVQIALTWMGAPISGLCTVLLYLRQSDVEKVSARWQYAIAWLSPIIALGVLALFCQTYVQVLYQLVQRAAGSTGLIHDILSPVSANYTLATGLPALVCVLYGASKRRYVFFGAPKDPYYDGSQQVLLALGFLVGGLMAADYFVAAVAYTMGNLAMGLFTGSPVVREGIGSLVTNALSTLGGLVLALLLLGVLKPRWPRRLRRLREQRRQRERRRLRERRRQRERRRLREQRGRRGKR